ncbi:MAG: hypothetical protein KGH65_05595 [Candidatus Micrarchaeota archaeon]|nr:hypothetical protein [Candidatus Micrarchaeota archaeon]
MSEVEEMDVRKTIPMLINNYKLEFPFDDIGIVTGDAEGVDKLVWEYVKLDEKLRKFSRRYEAIEKSWSNFKPRNIAIAERADRVICLATKFKNQKCYHCEQDHQRTGGCWTMQYAKKLGKSGYTIVI